MRPSALPHGRAVHGRGRGHHGSPRVAPDLLAPPAPLPLPHSQPVHPDALIFDLDGTLWDTCATCAVAWNRVLVRHGIAYRTMIAEDVRAVAGRPHLDAIATPSQVSHRAGRRPARGDGCRQRGDRARRRHVYPGVLEHVPKLARRLPLLIVSNCQTGYIETFLKYTASRRTSSTSSAGATPAAPRPTTSPRSSREPASDIRSSSATPKATAKPPTRTACASCT